MLNAYKNKKLNKMKTFNTEIDVYKDKKQI